MTRVVLKVAPLAFPGSLEVVLVRGSDAPEAPRDIGAFPDRSQEDRRFQGFPGFVQVVQEQARVAIGDSPKDDSLFIDAFRAVGKEKARAAPYGFHGNVVVGFRYGLYPAGQSRMAGKSGHPEPRQDGAAFFRQLFPVHMIRRTHPLFFQAVAVVFHKFRQAFVRQVMMDESCQDFRRDRGNIHPGEHHAVHVLLAANAGGDNLRRQAVGAEDPDQVFHEGAAVFADIIEAADKGADIGRSGTGGQHGLSQAEDKRAVRPDALGAEDLNGLQAFGDAGNLNNDIVGDPDEFPRFPHHPFAILADDFGADRSRNQFADFGDDLCLGTPRLRDEGRIGRHAIYDALIGKFLDFFYIGRVHKDFHCTVSFS